MTAVVNVCGTGSWSGPLPGDPDVNNSVLSAAPAFGGVDVSWTYPGLNAHAVAHTLLYRATTGNFSSALQRAVVSGNVFYDKTDANQQYFYWIKIVSVNGTVGSLIGPAMASARPLIADLIDQLSGQINDSFLGQALKTKIDKITLNYSELTAEIAARMAAETTLSVAYSNLSNDVAQTMAYIGTEITTRANGDDALAQQMTTLAAQNSTNAAAIFTERTARVTADSATATAIDRLLVATGENAAAVTNERTARTTAISAVAGQVDTVQSTLAGNVASVRTSLQSNINTLDGKVSSIGASYTVKLDVNGLVAGFGLYNTGVTTSAGFNVDTFFIGQNNVRYAPFIVTGGQVFIKDAAIEKLTFSKLRDEAGTFVVANGQVKANYIDTKGLIIRDGAGNPIFGSGVNLGVSFINGLGSLATRNSVFLGEITGIGTLASQNEVRLGHNVVFPDGSIIHSGDLVSRLSKINSGTINTFMDGAAITNAYIGNASVDTLKIQNNAVTIPVAASGGYSASVSVNVHFGEPTTFHIIGTFTQGTGRNAQVVRILVNGASVTAESPQSGTTGAMAYQAAAFTGFATFTIQADNNVGDMRCSIIALGVKK